MGTNPILRLCEQKSLLDFMELNLENLKNTHSHIHTQKHTNIKENCFFFDSLVKRYGIDEIMYSPPNGKKS